MIAASLWIGCAALLVASWLARDGRLALIGVGVASALIVGTPLLRSRRFDPFDPLTLVVFSVAIGAALRSVFLATAPEDASAVVTLTDGVSAGTLALRSLWTLLGLSMLSLGYLLPFARVPIERLPVVARDAWSSHRSHLVVAALVVTSLIGNALLIRATGVEFGSLVALSAKRAVEVANGSGQGFANLGYLRWASDLAKIACLLAATRWFGSRARHSPTWHLGQGLYVAGLAGLAMVWPVLSSSRTGVLELAFALVVLYTYLRLGPRGRSARGRFLGMAVVGVLFALFVLVSLGLWRQASQRGAVLDRTLASAIVSNTIASGNFFPLARTAVILDRVPERYDFRMGGSYASVLAAPVPRRVWSGKPEALGRDVRSEIYGRPTFKNGYPPGLVGEAYINFGYLGVVLVPLLAGVFLRVLYRSFRPLLGWNLNATLLYAAILWEVGFNLVAGEFSANAVNLATTLIPLLLALAIVGRRRPRADGAPAGWDAAPA